VAIKGKKGSPGLEKRLGGRGRRNNPPTGQGVDPMWVMVNRPQCEARLGPVSS
jgi:hypothetical protein